MSAAALLPSTFLTSWFPARKFNLWPLMLKRTWKFDQRSASLWLSPHKWDKYTQCSFCPSHCSHSAAWRRETSHSYQIFVSFYAPSTFSSLFLSSLLCASTSPFSEYRHWKSPQDTHRHTHARAPTSVHTQTHGVPQTVLRLQQILANHMKRASSSCGWFIKKGKVREENPDQCSPPLAGCRLSLRPFG